MAGFVIALLGHLFFSLFFRSVAICFCDGFRARFVELYLLFKALLFAALTASIVSPSIYLANPLCLPLLYGGFALSGLWFIALYISTCTCIQGNMAAMRSPLL